MQPFVRVLATSLEITMSYLMVIMVMLTTTMIIMMLMIITMMIIMVITVMMMMIASVGPTDGGLKAKAGYDANFSSTLIHILCS